MPVDCLSAGILVADHLSPPLDRVPAAGELILVDDLPLKIGGCAANTAIDLARLEVGVGVVGCVGQDSFGRFVIETLSAEGVGVERIRQVERVPTSGTLIINVRGDDRRFIHTMGANAALRVEDIPLDEVRQAKVLYIGGYLLMSNFDAEPLAALFAQARAAGVKTVLDIVLPGPEDHWHRLAPVLAQTDVFLPNYDEALAITGQKDPVRQAERFVAAGVDTAVITCGGDGTVLVSGRERLRAATYPVDFVGATGAGDAFDAGYIAALVAGLEPRDCLAWGSALGASCVRSIGATESVFRRGEAEQFLREHQLEIETI